MTDSQYRWTTKVCSDLNGLYSWTIEYKLDEISTNKQMNGYKERPVFQKDCVLLSLIPS